MKKNAKKLSLYFSPICAWQFVENGKNHYLTCFPSKLGLVFTKDLRN